MFSKRVSKKKGFLARESGEKRKSPLPPFAPRPFSATSLPRGLLGAVWLGVFGIGILTPLGN